VPVSVAERVFQYWEEPVTHRQTTTEEQRHLEGDPAQRHRVNVAMLNDSESETECHQRHEIVDNT